MRKILIAALILAGGCDATRRDFDHCSAAYTQCNKGFACNQSTGRCERETDAAVDSAPDVPWTSNEVQQPTDVTPGEVALDTAKDHPIDVGPGDASPSEGGLPDMPIGLDGGRLDTGEPDGPNTCSSAVDCKDPRLSVCLGYRCVACAASADCTDPNRPFCSAQNTCLSCAQAGPGFCSGKTPVCDASSGRCVECVDNGSCSKDPAKAFCAANTCQGCNAPGASAGSGSSSTDGGTSSDAGSIDAGRIDAGVVPACLGSKPVCAATGTMAGQCVECLDNSNCSGSKPICTNFVCAPCTSDSQCTTGPGICMYHQDGRCASDTETLYVKKTSGCSGGSGTASAPYCDTQAAVNAVTSSRRVLALKGPATDALLPIASTPSGNQVSIIGLSGATTAAGAAVGVHVTAGDVYLRGLTVANGSDRGVVVESGATLRMDRCVVKNNAGGGLLVQAGASFHIENSVFDSNGEGTSGPVKFGGVYLAGAAPSSKPRTFRFNTIINNQQTGVVCAEASQAFSGLLIFGNINGGYLNCSADSTNSKWDSPGTGSDVSDPRLSTTNPYHLTSSARCKDFIDSVVPHPLYDLDGDARPYPANGKLDCGADEFRP